jgi:hypothetical protein
MIDEILQHPYFLRLQEFYVVAYVEYGQGHVEDLMSLVPNEEIEPIKMMARAIKEVESRMPGLVKRGVLKIEEYFR